MMTNCSTRMREVFAFLLLVAASPVLAQEDCDNIVTIPELAAQIQEVQVDTIIMLSEGNYEVHLTNGTMYTLVLGCTEEGDDNYNSLANTDDGTCVGNCVDVEMDGYTYETVQIGDLCWFSENLRTTVYEDGSAITAVTDESTWAAMTNGAWADLEFDASNGDDYGHLYNWHAVDNASGLCPSGWHVASATEWDEFKSFLTDLGYDGLEGSAAAEPGYWTVGFTAIDAVGFSARGGGYISTSGTSLYVNEELGFWWTSSQATNNQKAKMRWIDGELRGDKMDRDNGYSVRCIQDSE